MHRKHAPVAPKALVASTKDDPLDADLPQRRGTHDARLDCDIQCRLCKRVVAWRTRVRGRWEVDLFGRVLREDEVNGLELCVSRCLGRQGSDREARKRQYDLIDVSGSDARLSFPRRHLHSSARWCGSSRGR